MMSEELKILSQSEKKYDHSGQTTLICFLAVIPMLLIFVLFNAYVF